MPFIDETIVKLKAGTGGDGCLSFRREKYIPFGGPDGGDGGWGGNVVLLCDENVSDLSPFAYEPERNAENGQHGMGAQCTGKEGKDAVLHVPEGTEVYQVESRRVATTPPEAGGSRGSSAHGESASRGIKVAELLKHGDRVVLLKGGKGGLGNPHFKSSINRAPRQTTNGKPGQEGIFRLELKCIADIGLVGFPNAGKSSLINALTRAQSKVAAYPFTTLNPHLGRLVSSMKGGKKIVMADIPGLIEGASDNRGLGHKFLKHIERCKLLLFVIDAAGSEGRDPQKDFAALVKELWAYNVDLLDKPRLVIANKTDLIDLFPGPFAAPQEEAKKPAKKSAKAKKGAKVAKKPAKKVSAKAAPIEFILNKKKQETFKLSCSTGEGLRELQERIVELLP